MASIEVVKRRNGHGCNREAIAAVELVD